MDLNLLAGGLAGLIGGGLGASAITAASAHRLDSSSWTREQRLRAFQRFTEAIEASINTIAGDPVDTALGAPGFEGLDLAGEQAQATLGPLNRALAGDLLLMADDDTFSLCTDALKCWSACLSRSCPISGCAHPAALRQHREALRLMTSIQITVGAQMRRQLHGRRTFRLRQSIDLNDVAHELQRMHEAIDTKPLETLIQWRVRRWTSTELLVPDPSVGYLTNDYPWSALPTTSPYLLEPIAAMLRRTPNEAWKLAVSIDVPTALRNAVYKSVAQFVTRNGRTDSRSILRGNGWVEGPLPGERLHFWTMDHAIQQGKQLNLV